MQHRQRDYASEDAEHALSRKRVADHPLTSSESLATAEAPSATTAPAESSSVADPLRSTPADPLSITRPRKASNDPLSGSTVADPLGASKVNDPLMGSSSSAPTANTSASASAAKPSGELAPGEELPEALEEWDVKKAYILQRFTCNGSIRVTTSFDILSQDLKRGRSSTAARLQELQDPEKDAQEEVKMINMQEYVTRLRELNDEIAYAWLNSERVTALKTAIKVARLLSDTSVPAFYPTLFTLVTEVMDTVGRLVFDRIRNKAEREDDGTPVCVLPSNFNSDDVRQDAKDTCTNWFYKIGAIPDLLPRIYLEMAIVRCYHFLHKGPPIHVFERLSQMIRGISDPLAAVYCRTYLVRRGAALLPFEKNYLVSTFADFMPLYSRLQAGDFNHKVQQAGFTLAAYMALLEPAIEWLLSRACWQASRDHLQKISRLIASPTAQPPPDLMHCFISALPAEFVASGALAMAMLVKKSAAASLSSTAPLAEQEEVRKHAMEKTAACYRALGEKLVDCAPPPNQQLPILSEVWKIMSKWEVLGDYLKVADIFVEYTLTYLGPSELDVLLSNIQQHLEKAEKLEGSELSFLESLVFRVVGQHTDLAAVVGLQHFMPIIDAFHSDAKVATATRLLRVLAHPASAPIEDPVVMHFVFEQARTVHDALDSMSAETHRKEQAALLVRFVQAVEFGRDLQQHLNFLVDCRRAFSRMEPVQEALVHAANALCVAALRFTRGQHSKRTTAFVKACVAFNQITIPSILDTMKQLRLYLVSAQVALLNGMVPQGEALLRSALTAVAEALDPDKEHQVVARLGAEKEAEFLGFVRTMTGLLVVLPGNPEPKKGPFYLLKGLLKILDDFPWSPAGDGQVRAYIGLVPLTAALAQERLIYHMPLVESNDVLYAGDQAYQEELIELTHSLVKRVVALISAAGSPNDGEAGRRRGLRLLDMCNTVIIACERNQELATLLKGLLTHAHRLLPPSTGYLKSTTTYTAACTSLQFQ